MSSNAHDEIIKFIMGAALCMLSYHNIQPPYYTQCRKIRKDDPHDKHYFKYNQLKLVKKLTSYEV